MPSNTSRMLVDDGVLVWFDGPEWDDVAAKVFEEAAEEIQVAAKRDAPWSDITGEARRGLETKVEESHGEIVLTLYHTVEHGLWLEVIQNGKWATIMPTLEKYASKVFRNAEAKVAKARRGR